MSERKWPLPRPFNASGKYVLDLRTLGVNLAREPFSSVYNDLYKDVFLAVGEETANLTESAIDSKFGMIVTSSGVGINSSFVEKTGVDGNNRMLFVDGGAKIVGNLIVYGTVSWSGDTEGRGLYTNNQFPEFWKVVSGIVGQNQSSNGNIWSS